MLHLLKWKNSQNMCSHVFRPGRQSHRVEAVVSSAAGDRRRLSQRQTCVLLHWRADCTGGLVCSARILPSYPCTHTHTHNHFTALFPGPPGWAGARRGLLDFMAQGKINRGRHRPSGWVLLHPDQLVPTSIIPPIFYRLDALPAAQPTVSKHWRTGAFGLGRRC